MGAGGEVDPPKARVFEHHLVHLPAELVERICAELLPLAGGMTTGQLAAWLARRIISLDPDRARDQYERAVAERGVVAYLNPDGTATLIGHGLAPDEVAAASNRIHQLATQAKRAGHPGGLDQIKADVMVGLLDGRFHGHTTAQIIATLLAAHTEPTPTGSPAATDHPTATDAPATDQPAAATAGDTAGDTAALGRGQPEKPVGGFGPGGETGMGVGRGVGVEVSVELATLLGHNDHPATLPGLGPVLARCGPADRGPPTRAPSGATPSSITPGTSCSADTPADDPPTPTTPPTVGWSSC